LRQRRKDVTNDGELVII